MTREFASTARLLSRLVSRLVSRLFSRLQSRPVRASLLTGSVLLAGSVLLPGCPDRLAVPVPPVATASPGLASPGPASPATNSVLSGQVFAATTASPYAEAPVPGALVYLETLSGEAYQDASGDFKVTADRVGRFRFRPMDPGGLTLLAGALIPGNRQAVNLISLRTGTQSVRISPASTLAVDFLRGRRPDLLEAGRTTVLEPVIEANQAALMSGLLRSPDLLAGAQDQARDRYMVDFGSRSRALSDLWAGILATRPVPLGTFAGTWQQGSDGDGGPATGARLNRPAGIAFEPGGSAYLAEEGHHRIRVVAPDGTVERFAGSFSGDASVEPVPQLSPDGTPRLEAVVPYPRSLAVDPDGNVVCALASHQVILIPVKDGSAYGLSVEAGRVYRVAGEAVSRSPSRSPDAADTRGTVRGFETSIKSPGGIALDDAGNLFVAERLANRVLRIDRQTGILTLVAGDPSAGTGRPDYFGDGLSARSALFNGPVDLAWASAGGGNSGDLFVFDSSNNAIRRIRVSAGKFGTIETFVGSGPGLRGWTGDGTGARTDLADPARFQIAPGGLAADAGRRRLYFADTNNLRIRMVNLDDPTRAIVSVAGGDGVGRGTNFRDGEATRCAIIEPTRLAIDPAGNLVFSDRYQYVYRILYGAFEDR